MMFCEDIPESRNRRIPNPPARGDVMAFLLDGSPIGQSAHIADYGVRTEVMGARYDRFWAALGWVGGSVPPHAGSKSHRRWRRLL
jgi:hypothetical protein